ncbi:putative acetyltransferase [Terracoccus luteus]|uniref:Putative acetyltransferase n=1 Tax=Terracoccus luteus TaxID=53356 RepID=A0A495Y1S4_9MICO|nr:GNAT family N-acetyltransferase [Terracoccus luteus]RKT79154.1 putative acetyltransferase [Terracoccus luteus]
MTVEPRPLAARARLRTRDAVEADLPAILSIRNRSFGPLRTGEHEWWQRVAAETLGGRMLVVVDDTDTVVASGRIRPFEQAWGGRVQPMGGVAGVYVEPGARGGGVGTTLTRALLARMAELGDAVSCLYPTTAGLYRRSGYEVGGVQQRLTWPGHALRSLARGPGTAASGRVRPARPDDAAGLAALHRRALARDRASGPMPPTEAVFARHLADPDTIAYVADDGFVVYELDGSAVTFEHLVAAAPDTARALWSLVGSGSSAAPTVHAWLDPRDAVGLVLDELPATEVRQVPWMARVVDVERAFAARGFAPHLEIEAVVAVTDDVVPANSGRWHLRVSGGEGTASRVGGPDDAGHDDTTDAGPLRLGARGLAALWCGWTVSRLRLASLGDGGDGGGSDDDALDAIFAGAPHLTEYF